MNCATTNSLFIKRSYFLQMVLGRNPLTDKPFLFGIYFPTGQHAQWGEFFSGIVDDFVIFNTALSENDVDTLMNQGLENTDDIETAGKLTTTWAKIKGN